MVLFENNGTNISSMVYIVDVVVGILISRFLLDLRQAARVPDRNSSMSSDISNLVAGMGAPLQGRSTWPEEDNLREIDEDERGWSGNEGRVQQPAPFPEGSRVSLSPRKNISLSLGEEIEMVEWAKSGSGRDIEEV